MAAKEPSNGPKALLILSMDQDDAQKLLHAFKEGKLADLGVINVVHSTESEYDLKQWTEMERKKRHISGPERSRDNR